ncbi:ABC transporter permease [Pelagibius sp. Alg239-R121]|uniref:ABC transporter permease n=1 Tax=Pelagibius sp. Alg239-R121 TaxID=2993448 RepID=UPI0024A747BD|nr:ABC transporter permease [Pelagibius sp. Alg239-R121]
MSYPIKRLLVFPLVMLGVAIFVFIAIRLVPGDAITAMLGTESGLLTSAQREALSAYFGLDQNWFVQFWRWLVGVLQGNLGISTTYGKPVITIIWEHFPLTLELAVLSMLIALTIGIPAGIYAAANKDRPSDLIVRFVAMFGQSTPSFVVGLLLVYLLSVGFGVLPEMGTFVPIIEDPLANLAQMILPAITLGTAFAAAVIRMTRSTMLDILQEDYVRTARSKGMPRRRVIWRHALPNALIPVITLSGVEFGYLLGGAVLVEQIFALPGLGRTVLNAILQRDYALVQGSVLFIAFNFMIVNLLVDLAYAALDPRIRFESK